MKKLIIIAITILCAAGVRAQEYKVIVNQANSTATISKAELSDFLLKKRTKWSNGEKVAPVDQADKSAVRAAITADIHGKSVSAVKSYWQQYVFSGKGTPPVEKSNDNEVVEYVKSNPGAVGYVSVGANVSEVKILGVN